MCVTHIIHFHVINDDFECSLGETSERIPLKQHIVGYWPGMVYISGKKRSFKDQNLSVQGTKNPLGVLQRLGGFELQEHAVTYCKMYKATVFSAFCLNT